MTTPTREQILQAYKALTGMCELAERRAGYRPTEYERAILAALPPKPRPTMAEVEWDDEVHYLAEAEHENGDAVIMLGKDASGRINIVGKGFVASVYTNLLAPTGKRYTLTEVQE